MRVSAGEESGGSSVAAQAIEAQPSLGQIKPLERPHWAWADSTPTGDVADVQKHCQERQATGRVKTGSGMQKGGPELLRLRSWSHP